MRIRRPLILIITTLVQWVVPLPAAARALPAVPTGRPDATINLATHEGAALVKGQWRYSDTKIVEADFKGPGPDSQPTGQPIKSATKRKSAARTLVRRFIGQTSASEDAAQSQCSGDR